MNKKKIVFGCDEGGIFPVLKRKALFLLMLALLSVGGLQAADACKGVKKDGSNCKGTAQKGAAFCVFHNPANRCEGVNSKGLKCGGMKMKGTRYCQHHQTQAK